VAEPRATTIWLARHASTAWTGVRWCGRADPELDDRGVPEAERIAIRLASRLPTGTAPLIVASPARRTVATARAIAAATGGAVDTDADLLEVDVGAVEGLAFAEVEAAHPEVVAALVAGERELDWPGGETAAALRERAARAWARLLARPVTAGHLVVVSHGGLLRQVLRLALPDGPEPDGWFRPASALRLDRAADPLVGWLVADRLDADPEPDATAAAASR
jgi:ribonuclease H / adenosylcobalamin/alpha-ribazole phosphatase